MFNDFLDIEDLDLLEEVGLESVLDDDILLEANISSKDIKAPGKPKQDPRSIMITGADLSSHEGRMKVSKRGVNINRKTSHNDYISIYRKNQNTVTYIGDLENIDMTESEYQFYKDLFIRNENIIKIARHDTGRMGAYVDDALIRDEKCRSRGLTVDRDIDGYATISKKNSKGESEVLYREDIKGVKIKND